MLSLFIIPCAGLSLLVEASVTRATSCPNVIQLHAKNSILIVTALMVLAFLVLVTVALPSNNLTFNSIQNSGHFALFAVLGFIVLRLVRGVIKSKVVIAVVVSAVLLVALGAAVEWYQSGLTTRTASVSDFLLDIVGIMVGFCTLWALDFWRAGKTSWALLIAVGSVVISTAVFKQSLMLIGYDLFRPSLPVVREFGHAFAQSKLEPVGNATYLLVSPDAAPSERALRVEFTASKYSGVVFHESPRRWSSFGNIRLEIFNPMTVSRQIELRINDRLHNNRYEDRYNGSFLILPGLNNIEVTLSSVAGMGKLEARGRKLDIDDVSQIQLYSSESKKGFTLDILRVELF